MKCSVRPPIPFAGCLHPSLLSRLSKAPWVPPVRVLEDDVHCFARGTMQLHTIPPAGHNYLLNPTIDLCAANGRWSHHGACAWDEISTDPFRHFWRQ